MNQLELIDPRVCTTATAEMIDDVGLRSAIRAVRRRAGRDDAAWPYVERLVEISGRPAWAVDDGGVRYVVVGHTVFDVDDLTFAAEALRTAAMQAFRRLDAVRSAA